MGGEDGIDDAGFSVARLIPAGPVFLEATGQVFRGDSGESLFRSSKRGDLSYVGHLRGYHDLSESTNLDLGASYSYGHNPAGIVNDVDIGRFTTKLFGVDATLRWRPLTRAIYHQFVGAERGRVEQPRAVRRPAAQRWGTTSRATTSSRAAGSSADASTTRSARTTRRCSIKAESAMLTYWPSEFSQVRGQYRRTDYADGPTANELLFQFQFSIGAHGAHPF